MLSIGISIKRRLWSHPRYHFEQHQRGIPRILYLGGVFSFSSMFSLLHFQTTAIFFSNLFQYGRNHFAGTAPFCPIVHEDRCVRLQDIFVKGIIGDILI